MLPRVLCASLLLAALAIAQAGLHSGNGKMFQSNPFAQTSIDSGLLVKRQKQEANALIPDPLPGERKRGPSIHRHIDSSSQCTVGMLHLLNSRHVQPVISDLVKTTYFRYFKVATDVDCPFWVMNRMCKSGGGCHVCRCDENEVPLPWRVESTAKAVFKPLPLDFKKWDDEEVNMWAQTQVEYRDPDATYVNLLDNPESNTGYSGDEPRRIWDAIYQENCFSVMSNKVENMCLEERVFYRLISGLHTSITAHVFARWKLDDKGNWLPNQGLWSNVFGRFPERLDNLYFTLAFMLRALQRMAPHLAHRSYDSGNAVEDARALELLNTLAATDLGCSDAFSAGGAVLFDSENKVQLKDDLRNMFRNVSVIMNCVGCEKCKVWGKLNTLGLGTALKVMIAADVNEREDIMRKLQRNELVAFVNTIASFSDAVQYVAQFSILEGIDETGEPDGSIKWDGVAGEEGGGREATNDQVQEPPPPPPRPTVTGNVQGAGNICNPPDDQGSIEIPSSSSPSSSIPSAKEEL